MLSLHFALKLQKKRVRHEHQLFLIEGKKLIEEAVKSQFEIEQLFVTRDFSYQHHQFLIDQKLENLPTAELSPLNMERLSETKTPSGIVAVVKMQPASLEIFLQLHKLVAFENIKDPGNLGTMIRTADWFGVEGIIVTSEGVDPYNDKVLRATMGSIFHIPIFISDNLSADLAKLQSNGTQVIVSRPEANNTILPSSGQATQPDYKTILVIGNESLGTSAEVDQLADSVMSIPGFGKAESLNAGVSFGIMMYELSRG